MPMVRSFKTNSHTGHEAISIPSSAGSPAAPFRKALISLDSCFPLVLFMAIVALFLRRDEARNTNVQYHRAAGGLKTIARAFPAACCGVSEHNNRKPYSLSF